MGNYGVETFMIAGDSESKFESAVLSWLSDRGWNTHRAATFEEGHDRLKNRPFYEDLVKKSLVELNDCVTPDDADAIISEFNSLFRTQAGLVRTNKTVYEAIYRGLDVTIPSQQSVHTVRIVDLENPERNRFDALQQFRFEESRKYIIPDVVLLVNGIPFVIAELKASNRGKTTHEAIRDLHEYESETPKLFYSALFNVAATRQEFRYGAVGAPETYYNPWIAEDLRPDELPGETGYSVEHAFKSLCSPERLIEIAREFVFYNDSGPSISKIVPRHPQYFGTSAIKKRYNRARASSEDGSSTISGLVWHTQGSGKSYTMYYAARHVVRELGKMAIVLVDTLNLKEQFSRELRQLEPGFELVVPESRRELQQVLREAPRKIVLTNIHLFDGIDEVLCTDEAFLFSDEAHRFMEKDFGGHIDQAFQNLCHFGFTGTPVQDGVKRNTFTHFSMEEFDSSGEPFIHRYSMLRGVQEGVIVPVDIVNRRDALNWQINKEEIDSALISKYGFQREDDLQELVSKYLTSREVAALPERAAVLAEDIVDHFNKNVKDSSGANKSMVVTSSRESASMLGAELQNRLGEDAVSVLYTSSKGDSDGIKKFHTDEEERDAIQTDFKTKDDPKVLVVCDMLLTGFDAPNLRTIFLDRNLSGHTLMQAIARANRPMDEKPFGEIVDYWGVYDEIERMHDSMQDEIELYISSDKEAFITQFEQRLTALQSLCASPPEKIGETEKDAEELVTSGKSEKFLEIFKHLRDLSASIQPDKRMIAYDEPYSQLENVYFQIRAIERPLEPIERDQFIRDAKSAIEEGTTVSRNTLTPSEAFTVEDWMSEDLKVHRIHRGVDDVLSTRRQQTPAYSKLSSQVEKIISEWNQKVISSSEALDGLEEVREEFDEMPQPDSLSRREWFEQVVVDVLIEETPDHVDIDEKLVKEIVETFSKKWEVTRKMNSDKRRRRLTTEIRKSLLFYGTNGKELAKTDFAHTVCGYLIRNARVENSRADTEDQ